MTASVVSLIPNNALCVDSEALALRMEEMAERIRSGQFPGLERVTVLLEDADAIDYRCYGRPTTNMELVGMLEYAKRRVMFRSDDE